MNVYCIGRNYVAHAEELNNEVPSKPLVFMKPSTSILDNSQDFIYPDFSKDIHYEGELVIRIRKEGRNIPEQEALDFISDISFGIDFTARDVQGELKSKGHPWEIAKGFEGAGAIGKWIDFEPEYEKNLRFETHLNGEKVQSGNTDLMIFSFSNIIHYISIFFKLREGDIIYTGTPAGVGPVQRGDILEGFILGQNLLSKKII